MQDIDISSMKTIKSPNRKYHHRAINMRLQDFIRKHFNNKRSLKASRRNIHKIKSSSKSGRSKKILLSIKNKKNRKCLSPTVTIPAITCAKIKNHSTAKVLSSKENKAECNFLDQPRAMTEEEIDRFARIHNHMIYDLSNKVKIAKDSKFSRFISPEKLRLKLRKQQFFNQINSLKHNNSDETNTNANNIYKMKIISTNSIEPNQPYIESFGRKIKIHMANLISHNNSHFV